MTPFADIVRNKRVTQMGLGLLGRGVGDAAFLARHGAELIVTDTKDEAALAESLVKLSDYPNITFHLGEHRLEDFCTGDLILKGAGVPLHSPYIAEAHRRGIPVDMSASLVARIANIPIVGITGTRGKSTVTHLVHAILSEAYTRGLRNPQGVAGRTGLPSKPVLGGNVRGVSNLALLEEITPETTGVFELDSWQCQGFGEPASLNAPGVRQGPISPTVAAFTTFLPDHMNYYNGSMETYLADKANIFLHQESSDTLVIGRQAEEALAPYRSRMRAQVLVADEHTLPAEWDLALPGVHNRYNAGIALTLARSLGVPDVVSRDAIAAYRALPGRLEYVGTHRGIRVYNDNNATTPDATAVALHALDPSNTKTVILIAGGADKGLDLAVLRTALGEHARTVILLPGSGTVRLLKECPAGTFEETATLADAYARACDRARPGDTILFSPAFASFGQYANEYARNDDFMRCVGALETV